MKEPGSICPNCGRPLRLKGGTAKCRCGCELEFGVTVVKEWVNMAGCPITETEFHSLAKEAALWEKERTRKRKKAKRK